MKKHHLRPKLEGGLRGCLHCPLSDRKVAFIHEEAGRMDPRTVVRVVCPMMAGQIVHPIKKDDDPKQCKRLIHVSNKKMSPEYLKRHNGSS